MDALFKKVFRRWEQLPVGASRILCITCQLEVVRVKRKFCKNCSAHIRHSMSEVTYEIYALKKILSASRADNNTKISRNCA